MQFALGSSKAHIEKPALLFNIVAHRQNSITDTGQENMVPFQALSGVQRRKHYAGQGWRIVLLGPIFELAQVGAQSDCAAG